MKTFVLSLILSFAIAGCVQTDKPVPKPESKTDDDLHSRINQADIAYDSAFAAKLGSDEYGMARYVMAFLKKGPNRDQDSLTAANLQKAHLENISRMADEGKLVLAGPFLDDGDIRGIYIFKVATVEEARALTDTDPAIKAGRLVMELHPWYGSAVLPLIVPLHKRTEKQ